MSVDPFATLGLTLMKRLATWPPSKTQSTVSPAKTLATFSSGGRTISVDCKRPDRITGGVSASDTVTVRGAFGCRGRGSVAARQETEVSASPAVTAIWMSGFMTLAFLVGVCYTDSPLAKCSMPLASPYLAINFDRRTRSFGLVENAA